MGRLYQAVCPLCRYEEEFSLGGGLLGANLLRSMKVLPIEEQEQIQKLHDSGEVFCFSVDQKLARCICCGEGRKLKAQLMIEITDRQQKLHTFGDRCSDCNHKLEIYEEEQLLTKDTHASLCPKCGEKALSFRTVGFWD